MSARRPYGWRDLDAEVVSKLTQKQREHLVKAADGALTCPLSSHQRE
jgi:hypothetical protein